MSEKNDDIVGMGVLSTTPIDASSEQVWAAMVDKMFNTSKYLPVTDVKTKVIVPDQHLYREMLLNGQPLKENIYLDKSQFQIRAVLVGEDMIHFNIYHPDTKLLEYWQENSKGERIPWNVPKILVLKAMEKTKEIAEANK